MLFSYMPLSEQIFISFSCVFFFFYIFSGKSLLKIPEWIKLNLNFIWAFKCVYIRSSIIMETFVFGATIDEFKRLIQALICLEFMFILFEFRISRCSSPRLSCQWFRVETLLCWNQFRVIYELNLFMFMLSNDPSEY